METRLEAEFRRLFQELDQAGYAWEPLSPDRLKAAKERDQSGEEGLPPLIRKYSLGIGRKPGEPLVARVGRFLIPHTEGVYLNAESSQLAGLLRDRAELFRDRRVLDLGSGAGALSLTLSEIAKSVLGLELNSMAALWATAAARAQDVSNVEFMAAAIGTAEAAAAVARSNPWELAVFNPPMAIPSPAAGSERPQRDGGHLGLEIPLEFLEFARRSLVPRGRALFLATSPVLTDGREPLFARIPPSWELIEKQRLHADFNRALHRQDDYASLSVRRIELWFLHLRQLPDT